MAAVAFNYSDWIVRYPEFAGLPPSQVSSYFDEVCSVFIDNSDAAPVVNEGRRLTLIWMLIAHLAALAKTPLVGRISNAGEGSVSVGVDMGPTSANAAWFMQTKYGAAFWQASSALRLGRWIVGPAKLPRPAFGFGTNGYRVY